MNKFIWEKQNALSSEFCNEVIYKFERDLRKLPGKTLGGLSEKKKSVDLAITNLKGWENIDKVFCDSLTQGVIEYRNYISENLQGCLDGLNLNDTGYQIQRTIGGEGYYHWHHDFTRDNFNGTRWATFIWYLNDVDLGGETEFIDGTKIKPEEGKLIFFPATWDFVHRGIMPPKGIVKYLCTGWLYHYDSY